MNHTWSLTINENKCCLGGSQLRSSKHYKYNYAILLSMSFLQLRIGHFCSVILEIDQLFCVSC